jgi:cytochrome c556
MKLAARVVTLCLLGGVLLIPGTAAAQDAEPHPAATYRKALMQSMRQHVGALRSLASGAVAFEGHAAHHAEALHGIASMAGDAFPEGTGGEGSRALDTIWEDWDAFTEELAGLQAAAAQVQAAASGGDAEALQGAVRSFGSTCRSCHDAYRGPADGGR